MNGKLKPAAAGLILLVAFFGAVSCRTGNPLPSLDLSAHGWHILHGQALWKRAANQSEVAADLLLATNATGDCFVQLAKDPFPLVTAEVIGSQWGIEFGAGKYSGHGRGAPPALFPWFQLPRVLSGDRPAGDWRFETLSTNTWRLENGRTGETLEGGFFP